jgi:polysaccharide biosynthesis protein PslA
VTALAAGERPALDILSTETPARLNRSTACYDIRLAIATLDAIQTAGVGFGTARLLPGINRAIDVREAAVIAVTVSIATVALRVAMRVASPGAGTLWTDGVAAARAAASAVLLVGLVASALPVYAWTVGEWLLSWGSLAGINAYLLRMAARRMVRAIGAPPQFFLLGDAEQTANIAAELAMRPGMHADRVLQIYDGSLADVVRPQMNSAGRDDVALLVAETLDVVRIDDACRRLADFPGKICLAVRAPSFGPTSRAVSRCGDYLLIDLVTDPHGGARGVMKRLIDFVGAGVLLIIFSPVMLCAAIMIRAETSGPILFRQQRFGIGSQPIEVLKFRTMRAAQSDASGATATAARDPRVTPVGRVLRRLSIDELPQLLNVLRGDMSLVGPRPHPLHMQIEGAYYHEAVHTYRVRHRVKPGITGWAQINGSRGVVDTMDKAQRRVTLDIWYLNHWSLSLDALILLRTVFGGFLSLSAD